MRKLKVKILTPLEICEEYVLSAMLNDLEC